MNSNSYLCRYMSENSDWRESLKDKGISFKEEDGFAIFNYGIKCDFSDPIVQEARGIIIDTDTLEVVCWPFRKFGSWNSNYADEIDWSTARVEEKIDGSIIKIWFNKKIGMWTVSTNSVIYAHSAMADRDTDMSFYDLVVSAENSEDLHCSQWDKNKTYIFELVSPLTQVVIPYHSTYLYHIGTRSNITGQEFDEDIGVKKPDALICISTSLEDCINRASKLNIDGGCRVSSIMREGFVVVDANWHRIKVKSPDYVMMHHISNNETFPKERMVSLLRDGALDVAAMCRNFPKYSHYFKYYDYKVTELTNQVVAFCNMADWYFVNHDRSFKELGLKIGKHRFSTFAFMHIKSHEPVEEVLRNIKLSTYCKYIPDYKPEVLRTVFKGTENEN